MKIQTEGIATFGHPFAKGDLPKGKALHINGQPVQVDVKTRHGDGSAKYSILTTDESGTLEVADEEDFTHVPLPSAEKVAINGRILNWVREEPWLSGHLVSEARYVSDGDVKVIQDVRSDGSLTLSFWGTVDKKVKLKVSCRDWEGEWEHWPYSVYVKEFSKSSVVKVDMDYIRSTGAIPYFDLGLTPKLGGVLERHGEIDLSPMSRNLNKPNMGAVGQQNKRHVGLCPTDDQRYILTQDSRILEVMKAYSHGACSIGWHGGRAKNGDWDWDYSHQPAFHYMTALFTGDRVRRDLLVNQAKVSLEGDNGKLINGTTRAFAWKLRNVACCSYLTGEFSKELEFHLNEWRKKYVGPYDVLGEVRGFNDRKASRDQDRGKTSPWQQNYLMLVFCWMEAMGHDVSDIIDWKLPYHVGMCRDHGRYTMYGAGNYRHGVGDPKTNRVLNNGKPYLTSFDEMWEGNPNDPQPLIADENTGKPFRSGQYAAEAMGMICAVAERRPEPEIIETAKSMVNWIDRKGGFKEAPDMPKWIMGRVWEDGEPKPDPKPEPKDEVDPQKAGAVVEDYTVRLGEIDPLTKGALISETERLLEEVKNIPIMETVLVDHVSKSSVLAEFDSAKAVVETLPTQTINGTVGVPKADAEIIADTARTNIGNLSVLVEDPPPPPPPGDIIVPVYTKLFPLVPMDGIHPFDRGQGFNDGTCTFDPALELFIAQNSGQVKEWFRMPHALAPLGAEGTYMVDIFVVRWKEWDWINKRIDENELQPPQWCDDQVGGSGVFHANVAGDIQEQGLPRHREIYCQWNNYARCWDDQGIRYYLNGAHVFTHSHTGGFAQNTARWCFGANDRIKAGERDQGHTWAGRQYQPVLWAEAIDDKIGLLHAAKYADLITAGEHTAERLQDGPYDHLRGSAAYSCPAGLGDLMPLSIEAVTA